MAKNWTLKEAVAIINKGTDKEAIQELAKRFPLTSMAIAKMGSNAGVTMLFNNMPEHMTMLKMERSFKDGVSEETDDEDVEEVTEEAVEESTEDGSDLESMTTKQLYELCIKKGLKVSKYGKPKSYYIEQLSGASETEEVEGEEEEETEDPGYEDMSAVELFKLCKKRGLKAEPKKPAKTYIAMLKKADEDAAQATEEDDDDWDDEEEEVEEKPAKKAAAKTSKPTKKEEKKPAKKEAADDDDDDWDI